MSDLFLFARGRPAVAGVVTATVAVTSPVAWPAIILTFGTHK